MLRELHIENFALVDRIRLRFGPGLNAVTGETGAGKTILVEALALLLGRKGARPPVREGADEAFLQGEFDLSRAGAFPFAEMLDDEGGLLLERRIPRQGRARAEANGRRIPLEKLRAVGRALVDFHGQQERESLLDRSLQGSVLDAYAGAGEALADYRRHREAFAAARARRRAEEERLDAVRRREEYLRWQAREIDGASLAVGEEEELAERVRILREAERLRELVFRLRHDLREEEGSAVDRVGGAAARLERFAGYGEAPRLAGEACRRALAEIEEALAAIDRLAERIDERPGALDEAIARLETIAALERKHKRSVEEILRLREEIAAELDLVDGAAAALRALGEKEEEAAARLARAAGRLTTIRKKKAAALSRAVEKEMRPLALPDGRFVIRVEPLEEGETLAGGEPLRVGPRGADRIEFFFVANRGEPLLPLRRVASGGEISRVMLALKRLLADAASVPTAVFDEIDAGVGGDVGARVGATLAALGARRQILCVTHLPSIAGAAATHLHVRKQPRGDRTVLAVTPLDGKARVDELVRMLGGDGRREVSVPHAEEILRAARLPRGVR